MPKLKTNKSVKKRFKVTAKGKVKAGKQGKRHLLADKTSSRKRKLRGKSVVEKSEERRVKKLLPYG